MSNWKQYINPYEFNYIMPGSRQEIRYKAISTGQLKKLLVHEKETNTDVIDYALDEVIQSSIVSPEGFSIRDAYLQDRFSFLIALRSKTKGSTYRFRYTCGNCGSQSLQSINLDQLETKQLPSNFDNKIILHPSLSLEMGFVTRNIQLAAKDQIKDKTFETEAYKQAETVLWIYAHCINAIHTPAGVTTDATVQERFELLNEISDEGIEKINQFYIENDFGTDFSFTIKCPFCEKEEKRKIPFESFFV